MRKMHAIMLFGIFLMATLIFIGCSTGGLNLIIELENWEMVILNGKKGSKTYLRYDLSENPYDHYVPGYFDGGITNNNFEKGEIYPIENVINAEVYVKKGSFPTLNDYDFKTGEADISDDVEGNVYADKWCDIDDSEFADVYYFMIHGIEDYGDIVFYAGFD